MNDSSNLSLPSKTDKDKFYSIIILAYYSPRLGKDGSASAIELTRVPDSFLTFVDRLVNSNAPDKLKIQ